VITEPAIQHWLVSVVRSAELAGAEELQVSSDTPAADAWSLVSMAVGIDESALAAKVATHYRLELADIASADPHARKLIPARVARKLQVLPLEYTDRGVVVATADPVSLEAEREISHVAGRNVHFRVAVPAVIGAAIRETYPDAEPLHELPPLTREAKGGPHVLVVDDEADMRFLLRTVLTAEGFRVDEAADGPEALDMLASGDGYDLVTLDLLMKEMHGLEVLKRIRSRVMTAHLPVVVATASDDPAVEMELFGAGADDFVVKPVDPPRFVLRIRAVLRRYRWNLLDSVGEF